MTRIAAKLLRWYRRHGRGLPWRGHPDAYAVWVSEIMLQQTRVETVVSYFERWMKRFPSVKALADAPEQAALAQWEGLGYYSRARNPHKAARLLVDEYGGELPRSADALRKLPGGIAARTRKAECRRRQSSGFEQTRGGGTSPSHRARRAGI